MATVHFTSALMRFFPNLNSQEIGAKTIAELLEKVEILYPGMKSYLLEDNGKLRKHVNIFKGQELILDEENLSYMIQDQDDIYIFQALSGG